MGTKAQILAGEEACVNNAHTNEPLFVLRATDPRAADLVRDWARQYFASSIADRQPPKRASDEELMLFGYEQGRRTNKHAEALRIANTMDKYRNAYDNATGTEEERIAAAEVAVAAEAQQP